MRASAVVLATLFSHARGEAVALDPGSFDSHLQEHKLTIVEFYAPWCGHCQQLEPEWNKAAKKTRSFAPLAKVDADQHRALAERYGVSGYPTIKIFKDGKPTDYDGPRDAKGIVKFARGLAGVADPALTHLTDGAAASALAAKAGGLLVGFFREPVAASTLFRTFSEAASELPEGVSAAYASGDFGASFASEHGASIPGVVWLDAKSALLEKLLVPRSRSDFTVDYILDFLEGVRAK